MQITPNHIQIYIHIWKYIYATFEYKGFSHRFNSETSVAYLWGHPVYTSSLWINFKIHIKEKGKEKGQKD